jgi:hypothetical protein
LLVCYHHHITTTISFHHSVYYWVLEGRKRRRLTGSTLELLAEEDKLDLVVDGEHTSTGDTTEDVGTSTLEERLNTLSSDDLATGIEGRLVLDSLTRRHHHATTDGVKRVRGDTSTSGDGPSEQERGQEVTLKVTDENNGLERVVHAEVQTTVDDYTKNGGHETTVETSNTVRGEGLLVNVYETVELAVTTLLGVLCVVGETGTGVVEGVDEEEGSGTSSLFRLASSDMSKSKKNLHHRMPSYPSSTWRNHHAPSCRRTWTCRCHGTRS